MLEQVKLLLVYRPGKEKKDAYLGMDVCYFGSEHTMHSMAAALEYMTRKQRNMVPRMHAIQLDGTRIRLEDNTSIPLSSDWVLLLSLVCSSGPAFFLGLLSDRNSCGTRKSFRSCLTYEDSPANFIIKLLISNWFPSASLMLYLLVLLLLYTSYPFKSSPVGG